MGCPPEKTYELTLRIVERVTAERTLQLHSLLTDRGFEETTELAFANALHQNFAGCPLDPEILRVEPLAQTPQIEYLSRRNFPSHQRAQHLKDRFLERVNSVLFVFEPNELEDGVNVIYSQLDSTLGSWRCQICLAFALAAQSCDSLQENEQAFMWYENGRRYLDDLVEEKGGELLAMRGLLLMAIYLIPDKKQACKLYLGSSIQS